MSAWDEDATYSKHPELFICSEKRVWNESDCVYPPGYVSVATVGLICACCRGSDGRPLLRQDGDRAGDAGWATMPDEVKCNFCSCELCSCLPPIDDRGEPDHDVIIVFWTLNMAFIIFNIVFELMMLMYLAVRYCVQVAWALDYRLVPLNADRAFVADSLVRAAFELGNPDSPVLGVDPHGETTSSNRMRIALMVILYKAKVVGTGLTLKALLNLVAPAWFSIFAKPVSTQLHSSA